MCVPHKTAIQKGEAAKEVAGQSAKKPVAHGPVLKSLSELPSKCWVVGPHDRSGIQYCTKGRVGLSNNQFMLDVGSGLSLL